MNRHGFVTWGLFVLGGIFPPWILAATPIERRDQLEAQHRVQLLQLAEKYQAQGDAETADRVRNWLPPRLPGETRYYLPPAHQEPAAPTPAGQEAFQQLRSEQAKRLLGLAEALIQEKETVLVGQLVAEALREDPDNEQARRLLGFVRYRDRWETAYASTQLAAGHHWHPRFGWLPEGHAEHYEQGERLVHGTWVSAEKEAEQHRDIRHGWHINSDHYVVTTNDSLEAGIALSEQLEQLHAVWQQAFWSYLHSPAETQHWFVGKGGRGRPKRMQVVLFRSKEEYVAALAHLQPQIGMTIGIYFDRLHTAYFYRGGDTTPETVYHEGAHQLFQESRATTRDLTGGPNYWIVEGIACYFESWTEQGDTVLLGGAQRGRMPAARKRVVEDHLYVPLEELAPLKGVDLQVDPRLPMIYSQSTGMATYLMESQAGEQRGALNRFLQAVYAGRSTPQSLSEMLGGTNSDFDAGYQRYFTTAAETDSPAE